MCFWCFRLPETLISSCVIASQNFVSARNDTLFHFRLPETLFYSALLGGLVGCLPTYGLFFGQFHG
ncbi:MAG: hypothetical protein IKZ88_09200 [Neisseriaceae bacterium]|nr:hypothetical protein [Neisseriaceae bacterium]